MSMDISELVDIGLAGTDRDRVEIVYLEPARVATDRVVGLAAIVSQLVRNATELLSDESDKVRIKGVTEPDGYSILIIDRGVGMSDQFLEGLNVILANPRGSDELGASGVQLVAGLAARHGVGVRLEHGDPGVTARVSIPLRLLENRAPAPPEIPDLFPEEPVAAPDPELVLARPKVVSMDTQTFLESVFGPLRDGDAAPAAETDVISVEPAAEVTTLTLPQPSPPLTGYRRATLRTRIPGRNYNESDPNPSHTKPGEAAVEIKLALTDFTRGRQAAGEEDRR
jgi:hypothetical protein